MAELQSASSFSSTVTGNKKSPRLPFSKRPSYILTHSTAPLPATLLGSPRKETVEITAKPDSMAACFLQYCATCEKQISTPCNSILYCSEICRRKDSTKPLSAANLGTPTLSTAGLSSMTGPSPPATPSSPRSILSPRTPIGVQAHQVNLYSRIPTDNHDFKPDLDPTEWKPKGRVIRPSSNRYNSEAHRYLSSFHRSISKPNIHGHNIDELVEEISFSVPTTTSTGATPSLANTVATTASSSWSLATPGFGISATDGCVTSTYAGSEKNGYDFSTRPLPLRHSRWHSMNGSVGAGIDLVTPHVAPVYSKNEISIGVSGQRESGLGAFFGSATTDE